VKDCPATTVWQALPTVAHAVSVQKLYDPAPAGTVSVTVSV
jgi:hypothetical protein